MYSPETETRDLFRWTLSVASARLRWVRPTLLIQSFSSRIVVGRLRSSLYIPVCRRMFGPQSSGSRRFLA